MLIAIDWDNTYSADPKTFDSIIAMLIASDHEVIFVTGRSYKQAVDSSAWPDLTVVYTNGKYKRKTCEKLLLFVDIWIDDEPGMIEPGRILEWQD